MKAHGGVLSRAGGGTHHQLADVDIGRLVDGIGDGAGDGVGRNGGAAEVVHGRAGGVIGNALGQFRFGDAGRNQGHANIAADLLTQAF